MIDFDNYMLSKRSIDLHMSQCHQEYLHKTDSFVHHQGRIISAVDANKYTNFLKIFYTMFHIHEGVYVKMPHLAPFLGAKESSF